MLNRVKIIHKENKNNLVDIAINIQSELNSCNSKVPGKSKIINEKLTKLEADLKIVKQYKIIVIHAINRYETTVLGQRATLHESKWM